MATLSVAQVFTQKSDFIEPRHRAFSFMLGNKFYTGTGRDANNIMNNNVYEYDVSADSWSQLNDFPTQPDYMPAPGMDNFEDIPPPPPPPINFDGSLGFGGVDSGFGDIPPPAPPPPVYDDF